LVSQVENATKTFSEFSQDKTDREVLFSQFNNEGNIPADRLEGFRLKLIQHLSMNIVIKESR